MKKLVMISAVMTLCATAPAFANMHKGDMDHVDHKAMEDGWFNKIDSNGDGYISKEEHDTFGEKMFRDADTNGDGRISKDEMHAYKMKEMKEMKSSMNDRAPTSEDAKTNANVNK